MNFVENHTVHHVHHSVCLSCHHIPLLGSGNDDMGFRYFLLGHTHITGELSDADIKIGECSLELVDDLGRQSFERCYVDDMELFVFHTERLWICLGDSIRNVKADFPQDGQ